MRIRTINGVIRELRSQDSNCAITASLLRRLCRDGYLRYICDGNRMLVDTDDVVSYFTRSSAEKYAMKGGKTNDG